MFVLLQDPLFNCLIIHDYCCDSFCMLISCYVELSSYEFLSAQSKNIHSDLQFSVLMFMVYIPISFKPKGAYRLTCVSCLYMNACMWVDLQLGFDCPP